MFEDLKTEFKNYVNETIALRRHFHANPELSNMEVNTSAFIENYLNSLNCFEITRPAPYSVMAVYKKSSRKRVTALRFDIDALPIIEDNKVDYASKNHGVMHACGHDAHTAVGLVLAKIVANYLDLFKGEIRFLFQQAEEVADGGALQMVKGGAMDNVDNVLALHVKTSLPVGIVAVREGNVMAAPDEFSVKIFGKGGHGAYPHLCVDPIIIGMQIINQYQTIVSRINNPFDPLVLSVCRFNAGNATNIIPEIAEFAGTVRHYDNKISLIVEQKMKEAAENIAATYGAKAELSYTRSTPPVVNDKELAHTIRKGFLRDFSKNHFKEGECQMGADDFAELMQKASGCYWHIGASNDNADTKFGHHNSRFNIDEDSLSFALVSMLSALKSLNHTSCTIEELLPIINKKTTKSKVIKKRNKD